jgi:hypothetical protein
LAEQQFIFKQWMTVPSNNPMLVNSESVMIKKSNLQAMDEKLLNWSEQIKALAVSHQNLKREFESEFFKLNNAVT